MEEVKNQQGQEVKAAEQASAAPKPEPQKARRKPARQAVSTSEIGINEILLFNKYSYDVEVHDPSLRNYINLKKEAYPNSYRRESSIDFSKARINIIERLANSLMRGGTGEKLSGHVIRTEGRLQGKKLKVTKIIEQAFDLVHSQTGINPLQVLVDALEYSAPIEDTTRVIYGGITSNVAVDVSASRRLDIALKNIAMATIIGAFASRKTIVDALAGELILASRNDVNSYAIKRKNEIERMARSAK
ncbi:MAG: 30S ribosomal protein S7 [Candidatus Marsarchaeota archaeon]|jgi:small subunit ribosomal protein S7|nr:30S ribosomal protein S7 [Candidatus Marsarchaeota archaeon]MCL5418637.1 30S ribosomal protein S7 [Candidatus Marsarchaeota archaeon]